MQHTEHQGSDQPEFGKPVVYNEFFRIGNFNKFDTINLRLFKESRTYYMWQGFLFIASSLG